VSTTIKAGDAEFGEVSFPLHLTAQRQEVSPSRALQQLGERQVDELSLRATAEPAKALTDQALVEDNVRPAHGDGLLETGVA
jgi:hypothetical protein